MEEYFDDVVAFNTALADGLVKAYEDGYEQGKKDAMQWVSVNDRLPEESGEYLVYMESGYVIILDYSVNYKAFNAFDWFSNADVIEYALPVTHWMPLPPSPEGE